METNYLGAVRMTLTLLPHMLERGGGRVVNIASVAGLSGSPNLAAYVASKFAAGGIFRVTPPGVCPRDPGGGSVSRTCANPLLLR